MRPPRSGSRISGPSAARAGAQKAPQAAPPQAAMSAFRFAPTSASAPSLVDIRAPWAVSSSLLFNFEEWSAPTHLDATSSASCSTTAASSSSTFGPPAFSSNNNDDDFCGATAATAAAATASALCAPRSSYEALLLRDASSAINADALAASDPSRLAALLARKGHDAFVRRVGGAAAANAAAAAAKRNSFDGSGSGSDGGVQYHQRPPAHSRAIFENLSHSFVVVRPPLSATVDLERETASLLVVDAAFRDVVAVVAPPPRLAKLLDALPRVFVGGASALDATVRLVAAETRSVLETEGRPLPPWRSARAMLSKWMPSSSSSSSSSSGAAAAVVDERPSAMDTSSSVTAGGTASHARGLSPPMSPTAAFSPEAAPASPAASTSSSGCSPPPTAIGATASSSSSPAASSVPISLVAPPLARLSVSLLSSSLARASASASSAAAVAAKAAAAAAAAADTVRPVRRAAWAVPAP